MCGIYHTWGTDKKAWTRLICYKGTTTDNTWSEIGCGYDSSGNAFTTAPACTANNSIVTTTSRTVADSGCTFGLGNGLKIITTEIQISANTDYSWSYGTTFTNVPKIFIARRTGASTDTGVYTPWVRGTVGKSSCTIFNVNSGTVMLMAIGN